MVGTLQTQALTAVEGAVGIRFDRSPAWKFYVEVLGVLVAEFQECSGLTMEREVTPVREGGTNDFEWLLPGQLTYPPVTLKRGITYNRELWRWFRWGMLDGQVWGFNTVPGASMAISLLKSQGVIVPAGTSMSIVLGTVDGKVARHWDLIGVIPTKWTGPEMQAGSGEVAIETLEVRHQGIDLSLEMMTPMAGFF
jgi:phage tail-like protein